MVGDFLRQRWCHGQHAGRTVQTCGGLKQHGGPHVDEGVAFADSLVDVQSAEQLNLADGPTRSDHSVVKALGAQWVVPVVPQCDIWHPVSGFC